MSVVNSSVRPKPTCCCPPLLCFECNEPDRHRRWERNGRTRTGGSAVITVLGVHPKTCILLALLADPDRDYNMTDIARLADIGRSTVYRHIDDLLELGLIEKTRKAGNAQMSQINKGSETAESFADFERKIIEALGENGQPLLVRD
ncbi:winged helix-turn-helix domain-containing protein [Natrinema caseinilyticum]|uniref:winged helix-turn-helix domain-containing protein n=1 Tax=Natrinema caseinilyticum TaxID=2961570 RepID=UPI002114089A|nr:winged helix-turn-helix domain-containing protein [Natrinema caseinilyticum]